jgi:Tol biopolymer transport system component
MSSSLRSARLLLTAALALALLPAPADAQYFGTNKVQYKTLRFQVLRTEHFDVYFYEGEREGAEIAARLAERWHARLTDLFDYRLRGRQPLVLYASQVDFQQTNVIPDEIGEGTGGVTEPVRRRIVLPLAGPLADTDHVIGHELVHAFQYDMTSRRGGSMGPDGPNGPEAPDGQPGEGLARLPLWFVEGMAEYLTLGPHDAHTAMWLRDVGSTEDLPAIRDLDKSKYFPYRWGHAFWAYVGGRWSDQVIGKLLLTASTSGNVGAALEKVLGVPEKELSKEWQASIRETYHMPLATDTPAIDAGAPVIRARRPGGEVNVGPAISPDGRWIAFLSERGFFSMDLFVADASTGKIVRKLTDTASNPHYASLQFIHSAGAWDATGRHLAVATVTAGRPALAVFGWPGGAREREVVVSGVDEIASPTWSPDGSRLVFTGMSEGFTDLYMIDLAASTPTRLTHDVFADLQPAWSPDGNRIAFATDRFSTDLGTLASGSYRLALLDVATGRIDPVAGFATGKHVSPQWSREGGALYFIGDHDGVANVYRVGLASNDLSQLTTAVTGVSGITASSPALSVAALANVAAMTVYTSRAYEIYTLPLDGPAAPPHPALGDAAALPPIERKLSTIATMLADPRRGLPPPALGTVDPYKQTLSLESAGQGTIGLGIDRFGTSVGAGLGLEFSDMLNTHRAVAQVQVTTGLSGSLSLKDTAAQLSYLNQNRRWNWGAVGGQVPYSSGTAQSGIGILDGQPVVIDQVTLYRQTERAVSGLVAYPFNRARRVEFQGGGTQITFDRIMRTEAYSLVTGNRVLQQTADESAGDGLTFATTAAAFVSDTSHFGGTSPVQGERYRLEVAPAFGTVDFAGLLADYRRYLMPVPFYTVATRAMHYGRYGSDAEDPRLVPLYLGYPTLVRGYDVNSFSARECVASVASTCPVLDRLVGSRMAVGNVELRFPLLRPFGVSQRMYGPLPVEVALFADGGVAWRGGEGPSFVGGSRRGVTSAGLTLRVNLMGFAVGQFDIVRPFQRPAAGWVFQFNLAPGF